MICQPALQKIHDMNGQCIPADVAILLELHDLHSELLVFDNMPQLAGIAAFREAFLFRLEVRVCVLDELIEES